MTTRSEYLIRACHRQQVYWIAGIQLGFTAIFDLCCSSDWIAHCSNVLAMCFRLQPATTFAANLWEVGNTPTGNKLLERKVSGVSWWPEYFCPLLMPDPHEAMWVWSWRRCGCRHHWRYRRAISLSFHTLSALIIRLKKKVFLALAKTRVSRVCRDSIG